MLIAHYRYMQFACFLDDFKAINVANALAQLDPLPSVSSIFCLETHEMQLVNSVEHTDWCSKQLENPAGINASSSALCWYSLILCFLLNESILKLRCSMNSVHITLNYS